MNRLMFAGTNSGCGKTTVTCAVLSALKARGINPTAFKCGPDYIDPMFHRAVTGVAAYNLDPFFFDGAGLRKHLAEHAGEISVIEGAMGFYDGIAATNQASAYTVAQETNTPVVLVISAKGAGVSLGAVLRGFTHYREQNGIAGVIFNDATESRSHDLKAITESEGLRFFGCMPRREALSVPSRHLGLMTAGEITGLKDILARLGHQAEQSLDIDAMLALAKTAQALPKPSATGQNPRRLRVAVARDEAFCFLYKENLELLERLGCELVYFSPLRDKHLPENLHGLYLCGGYPELYAETLARNASMRESVRVAVKSGLPTIAECGGFLYLHETLDNRPMCGALAGSAFQTEKLQRFGYITLTAASDNLLCKAGEKIRAHEYHYWESDNPGDAYTAQKAGRAYAYPCVHATESLYAGFPHIFFPANPAVAENFVKRMVSA